MNKSAATLAIALEDVFVSSGRQPRRLRTDKGTEFLGQPMQKMLSRRGVVFFTAQHSTKASLSERFNRTLRGKLSRYFTATNAHRYLPELEDLIRGYNHTVHTTTKMKPADVNALNQHVVWKRMFGHLLHRRKARWVTPPSKAQFEVGDLVRIAKEKGAFEKAYLTNWTSERFIISKVILTAAGRYKYLLEDLSGEPLIGTFQKEELQKVTEQRRQIFSSKSCQENPQRRVRQMERSPKQSDDSTFSQKRKTLAVFWVLLSQKRDRVFRPNHSTVRGGDSGHCEPLLSAPGRKQECPVDFTPLLLHWVHPTPSHVQDA